MPISVSYKDRMLHISTIKKSHLSRLVTFDNLTIHSFPHFFPKWFSDFFGKLIFKGQIISEGNFGVLKSPKKEI